MGKHRGLVPIHIPYPICCCPRPRQAFRRLQYGETRVPFATLTTDRNTVGVVDLAIIHYTVKVSDHDLCAF